MDALRKAEESKKKAELEKNKVSSGPVFNSEVEQKPSGSAAEAPQLSPGPEPVTAHSESPDSAAQSDVDTSVMSDDAMDEDAALAENSIAEEVADEPAQDADIEATTFELEPRSETNTRAPNYSEEQLQLTIGSASQSEPERDNDVRGGLELPSNNARSEDAASVSNFLGSDELNEAVSRASAELEKQKSRNVTDSELRTASSSVVTLEKNSAQEPPGVQPNSTLSQESSVEPEIAQASIRERTADSRRSAKSVFTAKRFAQKDRQKLLIPAAGVAAVLALGFGFYLYVGLSSNTGISVVSADFSDSSLDDFAGQSTSIASDLGQSTLPEEDNSEAETEQFEPVQEEPLFSSATSVVMPEVELADDQFNSGGQIESVVINDAAGVEDALTQVLQASDTQAQATDGSVVSIATTAGDRDVGRDISASVPQTESAAVNNDSLESGAIYSSALTSSSESERLVAPRELVSFRKTSQERGVSPGLSEGFRAYQNGDVEAARQLYEQTIQDSPENIDALLGLAAIAARGEEVGLSLSLYSRVLVLDPSNALAKTAIRELAPLGSPAEQEKELRRLNAESPNVAPLAFAMGNFYAGQGRWSDAQQYYFRALQLAKSANQAGALISPDYAFNLAVSLERLNQSKPAASFYEEALSLAATSPANFDLATARNRLSSLNEAAKP